MKFIFTIVLLISFTVSFNVKAEEPKIQQVGVCSAVSIKVDETKPAQVTTTCPDGQVTIQFPDGRVKIVQPSGQIIDIDPSK